MKQLLSIAITGVLFGLLLVGCDKEQQPVTGVSDIGALSLAKDAEGPITVQSAVLHVYQTDTRETATANAHGITAAWDEHTVTFNSFGGAYNPAIVGSFSTGAVGSTGWRTVDVTSLVQGWNSGAPNYGILVEEGMAYFSTYHSSENIVNPALSPKLVITYLTGSGNPVDVTIQRGLEGSVVADTYIWAKLPDNNFGSSPALWMGNVEGYLKQILVRFEWLPWGGCTRTIGYWKTHAGFGPQTDVVSVLLPITLGTVGGDSSLVVTNKTDAVNVLGMKYYGTPSNGITKLYAQLLGAKLNIKSGTGVGLIAEIIADADAFLATHSWLDWKTLSATEKADVLFWQSELDGYNNGLRGPDHCD